MTPLYWIIIGVVAIAIIAFLVMRSKKPAEGAGDVEAPAPPKKDAPKAEPKPAAPARTAEPARAEPAKEVPPAARVETAAVAPTSAAPAEALVSPPPSSTVAAVEPSTPSA